MTALLHFEIGPELTERMAPKAGHHQVGMRSMVSFDDGFGRWQERVLGHGLEGCPFTTTVAVVLFAIDFDHVLRTHEPYRRRTTGIGLDVGGLETVLRAYAPKDFFHDIQPRAAGALGASSVNQ
jgi:hypothetical protein